MGGRAAAAARAKASANLGLTAHATFSGALAWPYIYSWPQRPAGLIERPSTSWPSAGGRSSTPSTRPASTSATRSTPARTCTTASPTRCSSSASSNHPRACLLYDPSHFVLQQLDYLDYIDIYHERIRIFHVKDAEFNPTGRQGVYGGFQSWVNRAGRFRSLGDGQVDFGAIFSKLAAYDFPAGRCSNGSAASSIPRTARAKARPSSPTTSSASPSARSTTSPAAASTRRRTRRCSASTELERQ